MHLNRLKKDLNTIKAYNSNIREYTKEHYCDESGMVNIDVKKSEESLVSDYEISGKRTLSKEFAEELESILEPIPYFVPVRIKIETDSNMDIAEMIKEYYKVRILEEKENLRTSMIKFIALLLIGVVLLLLSVALKTLTSFIYSEVISIAGTFSVWEAVDVMLIERQATRIRMADLAQIELMKIDIERK